jgi:Winged helix DNA-binding domain
VFDDAYRPMVTAPTNNILFVNAVVVDGEVVGQWRRTKRKDSVALATESFRGLTVAESGAVRAAAARYGAFVDRPVALTT